MSAYSASPPVTTRNTEPSTRNPCPPLCAKNWTPWIGFTAASTPGCCTICTAPSTPSVANQRSITGPKIEPMLAVPRRCTANSPTRIAIVNGTTYGRKIGVTISSPSTALSTEIAGRDHAVAVEQRGAEQADEHEHPAIAPRRRRRRRHERGEGDDPALAAVVRPHDEDEVLDRDDDDERPDEQREQPEDVLRRGRHAVRAMQRLPHRVERAGADVAVHDAERGERDAPDSAAGRVRPASRPRNRQCCSSAQVHRGLPGEGALEHAGTSRASVQGMSERGSGDERRAAEGATRPREAALPERSSRPPRTTHPAPQHRRCETLTACSPRTVARAVPHPLIPASPHLHITDSASTTS